MAEYIEREAAIALIEEKQKALCPLGLWRRNQANDREKFDAWQEIIDELNSVPAVSVPQWISVKDRTPEDNDRVIVFRPNEAEVSAYRYSVMWGWALKTSVSHSGITHWMPLPKAPKGENDG